jgi:hypothetical protein
MNTTPLLKCGGVVNVIEINRNNFGKKINKFIT